MAAQTANDEKTTESWPRPGRLRTWTNEGLEKGSLPEEDVSGRVSRRIHAIRW